MNVLHGSAKQNIDLTLETFGADATTAPTVLVLHGGAGPLSVRGLGQRLAAERPGLRVLVPTHPGFDGTTRPESIDGVPALATLYLELLAQLDARDVTVIGNSIGGWIAAEMASRRDARVGRVVLVGATGAVFAEHPLGDLASLTPDELTRRSYHQPERFRVDFSALPEAERARRAGNRGAIGLYAGAHGMTDPSLAPRLAGVRVPTLALWGESDGIVPPAYGRAFAAAIPGARFTLLPGTGHLPQLETPDQVVRAVADFLPA